MSGSPNWTWTVWERSASGWDRLIERLPEMDARAVADQRNQTSASFRLGTTCAALPATETPESRDQALARDRSAVEDNPARGPFPRPPADPERTAEVVRAFFEGGSQERSRGRSR